MRNNNNNSNRYLFSALHVPGTTASPYTFSLIWFLHNPSRCVLSLILFNRRGDWGTYWSLVQTCPFWRQSPASLCGTTPAWQVSSRGSIPRLFTGESPKSDSPRLAMVRFRIFQLYDGAKAIPIQLKPDFEFWIWLLSWAGDTRYSMPSCCRAAAASHGSPAAPQSRGKRPMTLAAVLSLTFSTAFSQLRELVNTLLWNRVCVGWYCPTVG